MEIRLASLTSGATAAVGTTVIIDVFRIADPPRSSI